MIELPDVQETHSPKIGISINQAGVEKLKLPFRLALRPGTGSYDNLIADVTITTDVDKTKKGISMSRLLLSLQPYLELPLNHKLVYHIMQDIVKNIGGSDCYIKFEFDLPIVKRSPLSDYKFPFYHPCSFAGKLRDNTYRFFQGAKIQYSSYCPCSAELSKDLADKGGNHGYPHAQRSFTNILVEMDLNEYDDDIRYLWLEDLIEMVYSTLKTQPYPIIKRVDEQEVARIASENPLFVEDAIRLIADKLNNMDRISDWIVKCNHEESIHMHDAIAIMWKGVENGFDGRKHL